jgi:hypothetical protein
LRGDKPTVDSKTSSNVASAKAAHEEARI